MSKVVIVSAARTAVGSFLGAFANMPASKLGAEAVKAALLRANVKAEEVDEIIFGHVLTAAQGQNPARQAGLGAGLRQESSALTINQVCGSGLRSVALGAQAILCGDAKIIIAGGQENMSMAAHAAYIRQGVKSGNANFVDTMISDGLWDAFNEYHMGVTAENVAKECNISREEQDRFAVASQNKAESAQKAGKFKEEIVPITIKGRKGDTIVDQDEFIRHGVNYESVSGLKPAFDKAGSVTAGNASGLNDGAAALVLMSEAEAKSRGLTPLATVVSHAVAGLDPKIMGLGPVHASKKALDKAGWSVADLDLIEANEAFAAQACAVNQQMGWDVNKVNVNGGAIAIGHPIGASGARVLVTLLHEMKRANLKRGLATLCIGGGMGVALTVERS